MIPKRGGAGRMKLASYQRGGEQSYGIVTDEGLIDLPRRIDRGPDLKAALDLAGGVEAFRPFENDPPDFAKHEVAYLPTIPRPDKILCIGLNYRDHAEETGSDIPKYPTIFVRFANSQIGHLNPMVRPAASTKFDYEGELAVIIGRSARHVARKHALEYIAGYTCFNDGTIRDWQGHTGQFTAGKNFFQSGAMGPWMTTADEVGDPSNLALTTRLNGEVMQQGSTADLLFDIGALVEYITTFTQLRPGDVIATGTPAGVGYRRRPPRYLHAGDVVEVEIEKVGLLRNPVGDEG
jgi:2-keto-4-pentenoate hydratase/2-oxohepta-3-ene-1,7-dioic acid hydratase in catechol pathway